ncbi:RHS repeat-associated core domain-containing protein [Enterobacter ludwigii]|uniref:RHS repeat-associated core domain-containing protein n=1 Tax=Enterobacter ludwigii TaxID=299767 RepID=UPI003BEF3FF0
MKAAGPDAVVEYEWSPSGRVVCERVNGQEVRSVYDETGQRIRTEGMLNPLGMSWHQGRLASLSVGEHQPLTFSHNAFGFEQRRSNNQGFALNHEWSETGQLLRQTLTPDSGRVNDLLERRYQYDALSRLTEIRDSHWGYQEFRLNGNGQISGEKRVRGERRQVRMFGYDSELNLAEIQSKVADKESLTTPPLHKEHTQYDVAGRVIRRGDTLCRYDECGRLIVKRRERDGFRPEETHFSWDANDRLIRVLRPDGARWRYRYDAFGRRVSKTREGNVDSARSLLQVDYRWDGDQLVGAQQWLADGSAARAVQWVYEPRSFRPLAQVEKRGETTWLHYIVTDLTGTARELCSEEGEVHWRGEQGLWGRYKESKKPVLKDLYPGDAANEEVNCDLRYPGQLYDAESGLYYNRYRYYDPELGQYLSPDPIGLAGGIRPQGYVHNPVEWIDPLGLAGCNAQFKSRNEAFRAAKRDAGIPMGQQPEVVKKVQLTDRDGHVIKDSNFNVLESREYHYTQSDGSKIVIQEHSAGHTYGPVGTSGNQGPHFNPRPYDPATGNGLRNGSVSGTFDHYEFP